MQTLSFTLNKSQLFIIPNHLETPTWPGNDERVNQSGHTVTSFIQNWTNYSVTKQSDYRNAFNSTIHGLKTWGDRRPCCDRLVWCRRVLQVKKYLSTFETSVVEVVVILVWQFNSVLSVKNDILNCQNLHLLVVIKINQNQVSCDQNQFVMLSTLVSVLSHTYLNHVETM